MTKRTGGLFDQIVGKQPDIANRLKRLFSGRKNENTDRVAEADERPPTPQPPKPKWAQFPMTPRGDPTRKTDAQPARASGANQGGQISPDSFRADRSDTKQSKQKTETSRIRTSDTPKPSPTQVRPASGGMSKTHSASRNEHDRPPDAATRSGPPLCAVSTSATRFPGVDQGEPLDLVIGLDFGTCATKVVVRDAVLNNTFLVDFGGCAHPSAPFLLPSRMSQFDGMFTLAPEGDPISNLKLAVLDELRERHGRPGQRSAEVIAYLALVLRYVRGWFFQSTGDAYPRHVPVWQVNLGLPAESFDRSPLCDTYVRLAEAAWILSLDDTPITLERAYAAMLQPNDQLPEHQSATITAVPEVVAAVTGYVRSDAREAGLHFLVDVGAGTMDLCAFIVHAADHEDRFPMLAPKVEMQGVTKLETARHRRLAEFANESMRAIEADPIRPAAANPHSFFAVIGAVDTLAEEEARFADRRQIEMQKVLWATRCHRDPNSPVWTDKRLPVFLCGGGVAIECYRKAAEGLDPWIRQNTKSPGVSLKALPRPKELDVDVDDLAWGRLGVAWGLSYPKADIGDMIPASEIEDIQGMPRAPDFSERYISKDMV